MRLWVVALVKPSNGAWDLVGVFSTREKAETACKDQRFCVMPIELDEDYGTEPTYSSEDYFPKAPVN